MPDPLSRRALFAAAPAALPFALTAQQQTTAPPDLGARVYNVRTYGAKGDGKTLDTAAIQTAIDTCTRERGGTVLIPAGDFVVGTVELKSNVTLHLAAAGRLLGSAKPEDYRAGTGVPPATATS